MQKICLLPRQIGKGQLIRSKLEFCEVINAIHISPTAKSNYVQGVIYEIDKEDKILLDINKKEYYGEKVNCFVNIVDSSKTLKCFTYVLYEYQRERRLPNEDYFNDIYNGYLHNNLSIHGLIKAWIETAEEIEKVKPYEIGAPDLWSTKYVKWKHGQEYGGE